MDNQEYTINFYKQQKKQQLTPDTRFDLYLQKELKDPELQKRYDQEGVKLMVAYELNKLRRKAQLSQRSLAKKLNTTQSVIARMENGNQNFTLQTLDKIARTFGKHLEVCFR